jgi:hypothetical protein
VERGKDRQGTEEDEGEIVRGRGQGRRGEEKEKKRDMEREGWTG